MILDNVQIIFKNIKLTFVEGKWFQNLQNVSFELLLWQLLSFLFFYFLRKTRKTNTKVYGVLRVFCVSAYSYVKQRSTYLKTTDMKLCVLVSRVETRHYPPTLLPTRRWQTLPRRKAESFSEAETANRPVRFAVNTRGIRRNEESSWHRRRHRRRWTGVVKGRVVWQLSLPLLVNQPNEP